MIPKISGASSVGVPRTEDCTTVLRFVTALPKIGPPTIDGHLGFQSVHQMGHGLDRSRQLIREGWPWREHESTYTSVTEA